MELKDSSKNVDKKLAYKLSHQTNKMLDLVGSSVKPEAYIVYEDADIKTGEMKEVVSILVEGKPYATISPTFIREFKDIIETFKDEPELPLIEVVSGKSKAGRDFITVTIA